MSDLFSSSHDKTPSLAVWTSHRPALPSPLAVQPTPPLKHDPDLERRAVRKLDYTLLPVMTMFYLLSFLVRDRVLVLLLLPNLQSC